MAEAGVGVAVSGPRRRGSAVRFVKALSRWPVFPVVILVGLAFMAASASWLAPAPPLRNVLADRNLPPLTRGSPIAGYPSGIYHPLGTDFIGRDILSRLMYGSRYSLSVVAVALVTGTVLGTALGLFSGYFGGALDETIMRLVDIWLGLPFVLVAMTLAVVLGPSYRTMIILLALLTWTGFVRNVRAETMSLKMRDYVALAKIGGAGAPRILYKHILPGVLNTVLVLASLRSGQLILTEAFLSFLGAGIPAPTPTWGSMISDGRNYLSTAWWITVIPGIAIFLTVLSLNFLGDWVRDHLDPRLRQI